MEINHQPMLLLGSTSSCYNSMNGGLKTSTHTQICGDQIGVDTSENHNKYLSSSLSVKKKGDKKIKKPRFAFQTRSQVDILDDGYRWRKYGQKAVKNNNYPRSYYRCTHEGCNVKKQVQRLAKDEGVVVTTYEGMHTHPIDKPIDNFDQILHQMHIFPNLPR